MELSAVLRAQLGRTDCALVDCLTIWLSNLLLHRNTEFASEKARRISRDIATPGFSRRIGDQRGRLGHRAGQCSRAAISRPRRLGQSADRRGSQRSRSYRCGNPDDREAGNVMSLDETLKQIRPLDRASEGAAQQHLDSLTKPQGSLGPTGRVGATHRHHPGKGPATAWTKTFVHLRRRPRHHRRKVSAHTRKMSRRR